VPFQTINGAEQDFSADTTRAVALVTAFSQYDYVFAPQRSVRCETGRPMTATPAC